MRNFYQSNNASSSNETCHDYSSSTDHQIIKHENNHMSCSFSSKNKSNKSILPVPLIVNHDSSHLHKRKVKLNNYNLSNLSLTSGSSLSPSSSSASSSSSMQTKSKFLNTQTMITNNVTRPNLIQNYNFNQTDNYVSDLLPISASSNESSSSLSSSLSIEATATTTTTTTTTFITEQKPNYFNLKENKLVIKKNSSLSSKTSSSSSSAYSSFGSSASSPAPSPNSYFNHTNSAYQIKQNAQINTSSNVSLKDTQFCDCNESTNSNLTYIEDLLPANQLHNNIKKSLNNSLNYKNHHKTLSRDSYSKMLNEEQNDRFFESNTLYKKELKQKQRDILTSPSPSSNSSVQYKPSISSSVIDSDHKPSSFTSFIQPQLTEQLQHENNILKSNSFSILSPQNVNTANYSEQSSKHINFNLKNSKEKKHHSHHGHTSSKVLNLFSNFLNRNKASSPGQALVENNVKSSENLINNNKDSNNGNYLNLKYLKRASSSTHFNNKNHSSSNENNLNRKSSTSKFLVNTGKIAILPNSPSHQPQLDQTQQTNKPEKISKLFNSNSKFNYDEKSSVPSILVTTHDEQEQEHLDQMSKSSKYNRRSYDDVSNVLHTNHSEPLLNHSISSFNSKFDNTTFSTKNNGLIFMPSPKACEQSSSSLENLNPKQTRSISCGTDYLETSGINLQTSESVNNYDSLENDVSASNIESITNNFSNSGLIDSNIKSPVQLNIVNLSSNNNISKTPTTNNENSKRTNNLLVDDSSAFDNVFYSYVDNIRQHSKRLSEINMFSHFTSAAANNVSSAVINSVSNNMPSSSSSSSLSNKNSPTSLNQLSVAATAVQQQLLSTPPPTNTLLLIDQEQRPVSPNISSTSSFNNSYSKPILNNVSNQENENSFENQSYVRITTSSIANKSKTNTKTQFNSNNGINLNSPASSLASSSSSSNCSSNLSISPKSLSSSETVIINSNLMRTASNNQKPVHTTPTSNVMSLKEKFEQFNDSKGNLSTTPSSSNNKLNRNSAHILTYKEFKLEQANENNNDSSYLQSSKIPQSIPIVFQASLTSSMSNMSKMDNNSSNLNIKLQNNLSISTSSTQINQQGQTNSPVSTMSSISSLSDSSIKDSVSNTATLPTVTHSNEYNPTFSSLSSSSSSSSSSTPSNYDQSEGVDSNEFNFNFLNEFYRLKTKSDDTNDTLFMRKSNQFYLEYQKAVDSFIRNYYSSSCFFIQHVLNPILVDFNLSQPAINGNCLLNSQQTESLFCFKFTIDYLKPNIFSKLKIKSIENDLLELIEMNINDCTLDQETKQAIELTNNCYNHLINDLIPSKELLNIKNDLTNQFEVDKKKLRYFIVKKIHYFEKHYKNTMKDIEMNNTLGNKILKILEQDLNITSLELDKFKLLVNESDVINNLSLKLCNKLANTENSIQIIQLKQMQNINYNLIDSFITSPQQMNTSLSNSPESNEEIELLKQELNQIQRKKEEAIFLKNGIDKRAATVSDFLLNYLNKEQHQEFQLFLQVKSLCAIQLRHIKDHIELSQLQLKLIDDLI